MRRAPLPLLGLLALVPPLAAQGDGQAPARPGAWRLLDRVELVANTDCLTLRALDEKVRRSPEMVDTPTNEERLNQLRESIARQEVDELLMRQAGEDLGFDEALVKARASEMWDDEVDKGGGITQVARRMTADGETVVAKREELQSELYTRSWRASVTGWDAGPGGRPVYDRFQRPGQLRQRYKRMESTGIEFEQVLRRQGAQEATYAVEVLVIDPQQTNGFEAANERAVSLREALVAGERDWDETVTEYGALADDDQLWGRRDLLAIWDAGDGRLTEFCETAQPGDLSPVLLYAPTDVRGRRVPRALLVVRFVDRKAPYLPVFDQPGVQRSLTLYLQSLGDNKREALALEELRRRAYIWYPGIEEQRARREAELEQQRREALQQREAARERNAPPTTPGEPKPAADEAVEPGASGDGR